MHARAQIASAAGEQRRHLVSHATVSDRSIACLTPLLLFLCAPLSLPRSSSSSSSSSRCINFANEKLQQFFNNYTFKLEESVYASEKIAFDHVSYIDNQPVLDLIEIKPRGILPMIDEELRMPNGTDKSFIDKLHTSNQTVKPYGKVLSNPNNFLVRRQ